VATAEVRVRSRVELRVAGPARVVPELVGAVTELVRVVVEFVRAVVELETVDVGTLLPRTIPNSMKY